MLAKILANGVFILTTSTASLWFVVHITLGIPINGSIPLYIAGSAVYLFSIASLAIMLATLTPTMQQYSLLMLPIFIIMNLFSGAVTSRVNMPDFTRIISEYWPHTQYTRFSQSLIFRGAGLDTLWPQLLAMGAVGALFLGYALLPADSQPGRRFGQHGEFFASGRLDNLSSVHAGLCALERYVADNADEHASHTVMLAGFDHEEVGSETRSGAAGPFLEDVLVRLSAARGENTEQYRRSVASSVCLSADAGPLLHPNYQGHHDPVVQPVPGAGPLLKINANQRYATDSVGAGIFAAACKAARVPYQEFVSNNNMPCGSTIGPITATRLGMRTVDVGVGLLSMHSAREMCHVHDMAYLTRAVEGFYRLQGL